MIAQREEGDRCSPPSTPLETAGGRDPWDRPLEGASRSLIIKPVSGQAEKFHFLEGGCRLMASHGFDVKHKR